MICGPQWYITQLKKKWAESQGGYYYTTFIFVWDQEGIVHGLFPGLRPDQCTDRCVSMSQVVRTNNLQWNRGIHQCIDQHTGGECMYLCPSMGQLCPNNFWLITLPTNVYQLHAIHAVCQIGRAQRLNSSHTVISYAVFCLKKKRNRILGQKWNFNFAYIRGKSSFFKMLLDYRY